MDPKLESLAKAVAKMKTKIAKEQEAVQQEVEDMKILKSQIVEKPSQNQSAEPELKPSLTDGIVPAIVFGKKDGDAPKVDNDQAINKKDDTKTEKPKE